MKEETKFEEWALLELFGHQRLAGLVTEIKLGGASFVRVDVPGDTKKAPTKLTRMYNPSAIYLITPVTEETARTIARNISDEPVTRWDVTEMVREAKRALKPAYVDERIRMTLSELALLIQEDSRRDISAALVVTAEALPLLHLPDGRRIHDQIDFHDLLGQLAEALLVPMCGVTPVTPVGAQRGEADGE